MTRSRPSKFAWIIGIAVAVSVALPLIFIWSTDDIQESPPRFSSRIWQGKRGDTTVVVYITGEDRAKSVAGLGRNADPTYQSYRRFVLAERRIPDGALLASVPLRDVTGGGDAKVPVIIGIVGDIVWIWRDSLEGRGLADLGIRATAATLSGGAREALAPLPTEPNGYAVRSDPVALIARGTDARFYTLDGTRSTIEPLDPGTLVSNTSSTRVDDRFDYLEPPGRSTAVTQANNLMQLNFLTSTGLWYGLLSESERAGMSRWPSGTSQPSGDVARSLYRVPYRLDDRQKPEIDPARLTPVGTERLIQAGFLIRTTDRVWDVAEPSSSLVFAKAQLGSKEPWEVVRLARDGTVLWRTSTELPDPNEFIDLGTHIGIVGELPKTVSVETDRYLMQSRLVWIDERTGTRRSLSVASGEVK